MIPLPTIRQLAIGATALAAACALIFFGYAAGVSQSPRMEERRSAAELQQECEQLADRVERALPAMRQAELIMLRTYREQTEGVLERSDRMVAGPTPIYYTGAKAPE